MNRRRFLGGATAVAGTTIVAGCSLGGETLLRKSDVTAGSATKEWERGLQEGDRLELAVTLEEGIQVDGYVHRTDDGEQIAWVSASIEGRASREEFEVPTTGTYVVSLEVGGDTGTVALREA